MPTLTDSDIAARIRTGRRCPLCRNDPRPAGRLCWGCHDELGRILDPTYLGDRDLSRAASIPVMWSRLDPTPGTAGLAGRRAPGFASAPPCNLTVVVMRDPRSRGWPVVDVWHEPLHPGVSNVPDLDNPHHEDTAPPRSVAKAVEGLTDAVAADLDGADPPAGGVGARCAWLHAHLLHITARDDADDIHHDLTDLHDQLRRATGDPRPEPIGLCTGSVVVHHTGERVECRTPLHLPPPQPGVAIAPSRPVLRCRRCDRPYTALMLLRLEITSERRAS